MLSSSASKKNRLSYGVRDRLLERLAAAGVLVRTEGTVLGFIPRTKAVKDAIDEAAAATAAAAGAATAGGG
jgi:hypothetical protein